MSGTRKWMVGSLTGLVVAVGALASLAGPAQAYDAGTCDWRFGASNVAAVDRVWIDTGPTGKVDFGDVRNTGDQVLGKAPAVVCWAVVAASSSDADDRSVALLFSRTLLARFWPSSRPASRRPNR